MISIVKSLVKKKLNSSIWPIDETQTVYYTTPVQSGPGSNGNEGVLNIPQSSRTGVSSSNGLVSYPGDSLCAGGGDLPSLQILLSTYSTPPQQTEFK